MNKLEFVFVITAYVVSIISVCLFWSNVAVVSAIIAVLSLIFLLLWHRKNDIITFIFGIAFGLVSESICVYFGAWTYTKPTFLVPLWLPLIWGNAAMIIRRFVIEIDQRIR